MVAPAIRVLPDDARIGLVGVRFPVELHTEGIDPSEPSTWPKIVGRLEYVAGKLLYMPPCADYQQDVAVDVAFVLRSWSEQHPEFVVGGNEAGMKLGGDIRTADVAVWRSEDVRERSGRVRSVPPILVVEVSGEDEDEHFLKGKARWYLEHGVPVVWLVLPKTRETIVVTSGGEAVFTREECLPTSEHLPDLAPEVSRFFAQLDR